MKEWIEWWSFVLITSQRDDDIYIQSHYIILAFMLRIPMSVIGTWITWLFFGKETDYLEHKCDKSRLKLGNLVLHLRWQQMYIHVCIFIKNLHDTITIEVSCQQVGMGLGLNGISNKLWTPLLKAKTTPQKMLSVVYFTYTTLVL